MGWFEGAAGLNGDEPADAFSEAIRSIRSLPSGPPTVETLLSSLLFVLNLDGRLQQFFRGERQIAELRLSGPPGEIVCVPAARSREILPFLYDAVALASESYHRDISRPPTLPELMQYLTYFLTDADSDEQPFVANPGAWALEACRVTYSKVAKLRERADRPEEVALDHPTIRVAHAKFGGGRLRRDEGASLRIPFDDGDERLIRREFVALEPTNEGA